MARPGPSVGALARRPGSIGRYLTHTATVHANGRLNQLRPYTGTRAPREVEFCGEARNAMVAATSCTFGHLSKSALGMAWRLAGVSIIDGMTAFTQMRSAASSSERLSVSDATAALLAA